MAGDNSDQKLAAIITPPVNPSDASSTFRLLDLNRNTREAPNAVSPHVNSPAIKALVMGWLINQS